MKLASMDCSKKCELILEWAGSSKFDTTTVESIMSWGFEHDFTDVQERAIDNIYKKWKVGLWAKKTGRISPANFS